ncbi:unnamed protein product [Prorocentrum cordatum]|uniref:SREBP regulating gene protein n=1 Tax=Prorocentrum cordatum TaxID=2364126 RepID=A0ABN9PIX4_9DINO|nr:unnamed protein product [Polarella glacialis]|mmetsp:Transcript_33191/g.88091  ORF Transcript_33191/g.88091 Transcript_33191/m.88091 type:complete len:102 (-) Transcript_33191:252-557(-)
MERRRVSPPQLGAIYSQNSGGNCVVWGGDGAELRAASSSAGEPLRSGERTQLSDTYCSGQGQTCDCNYCDDFSENSCCANTCRVMDGIVMSPRWWSPWAAN